MNLQSIRSALPDNYPVTGICMVADPTKNPVGYEVIYRSNDRNEDCDLWKDGLFKTKVSRYLCFTRQYSTNVGIVSNVLDDIIINNEKDAAPNGFSVMMETVDSHEKASRKRQICIKMAPRNQKNQAICDLIMLSKTKRPPAGYTLVGEINGLQLCFKIAPIPRDEPVVNTVSRSPVQPSQPVPAANGPTQGLPYHVSHVNTQQGSAARHNSSSGNVPNQQVSVLMPNKPLADVPFQLSSRFKEMEDITKLQIPELHYRSQVDIENEYGYDFCMERNAAARLPPEP